MENGHPDASEKGPERKVIPRVYSDDGREQFHIDLSGSSKSRQTRKSRATFQSKSDATSNSIDETFCNYTQIVTEEVLNEKPLQVATEEIAMEPTIPYPSLDEEIPDEIVTEKPLQVAAEEIAMEPTIPYPSLDEEIPNEIVTEKPLQVAAEEIAMESTTLYPSLDEEIPDEILERIINELREDPELRTVMTNIEQELEFEQLGCDLDIPEDIRLENSMQW